MYFLTKKLNLKRKKMKTKVERENKKNIEN